MLENKKIMPPPWIAYPEIERYSIGWRMGYGEDYIVKWSAWFDALSEAEQKAYEELFPEPSVWKGWWAEEDTCCCYQKNHYVMELWRESGTPAYSIEQIQRAYTKGVPQTFMLFWKASPASDGQASKSCFSQWWFSDFRSAEHVYCCMEQFMMANKAELFEDENIRQQILKSSDPKQIKALGRKVKNFDEKTWNEVKYSIVLNGNFLKFTQDPKLRDFLLSTNDHILAEASPYDRIWGIGMDEKHEHAQIPVKWKGQNLLGFALMEVRDEIRRVWKNAHLCQR